MPPDGLNAVDSSEFARLRGSAASNDKGRGASSVRRIAGGLAAFGNCGSRHGASVKNGDVRDFTRIGGAQAV